MESTGPNGYALFGAMGVFDWILQTLSRIGARVPLQSSTLAIALALMVGLKHPIRRRIGCFSPTIRANAMARVDDCNGTRAPILDSVCKIQSKTPIAPNRAYPFGPVLSMPETLVPGYH